MKRRFNKGEKAYLQMPVEVKSIDKDAGTLEAIFSTQDVDRHGDIVLQEGWDLVNFKRNPVILNSHNYQDAAEVIGKASGVKVEGKKLTGKITFAVDENPKAKVIFDLYAGGFLSAFSVGFIPTNFKENKDGSTDWFTIAEAELLEVSAVSVPANARALAKAKGIDIDMLKSNDDDENDEGDEPGEDDEVSEDNEVPPADGEAPAENGNGSEDEQGADDETPGTDTGAPGDGETVPDEEAEGDGAEEVAPVQVASYKRRVADAIVRIESREKAQLRKAAAVIKSLLDGDVEAVNLDRKTQEQIRRRKVNQVIRMLLKTK